MSHQTPARAKKTRLDLQAAVDRGGRLAAATAYDAPTALIADAAGVDIILVGDSVGNVCLGFENTLPVTMAMMRHHLEAVARARPNAFLMADLPFMSYHTGAEGALKNAGRLVRSGAQAVKLEGGSARVPVIRALVDAGIPVMGHLGLTPQSIHSMGGHRVQCRDEAQAVQLLEDAKRLEAAGCFSVLLECVPLELAALVTEELGIFTIGIGAGPHCSGQVLVFHDLLGLHDGPCPRFVRKYMDAFGQMTAALSQWSGDVKNGVFTGGQESYNLTEAAREGLAARFPGVGRFAPAGRREGP
jgi:3-methyl-2-oxobutanoate hydroxymethyltransferase